jgi:hypothetical protein
MRAKSSWPVAVTRSAAPDGGVSRRLRAAIGRVDANTYCPSRTPSPSVAFSRGCRCAAQTESPSTRRGREWVSVRRAGGCAAAVSGGDVRFVPISRRQPAPWLMPDRLTAGQATVPSHSSKYKRPVS